MQKETGTTQGAETMHRINRILRHPLWQGAMVQIEEAEKDRIYCRHDLTHLLDTARLAYIENLEKGLGLSKELIYGAALLHDIGRGLEYTQGVPHDEAGSMLAGTILQETGFCESERMEILNAIASHRGTERQSESQPEGRLECKTECNLAGLLYRADKGSRNCFYCKHGDTCKWSEEKKNKEIKN